GPKTGEELKAIASRILDYRSLLAKVDRRRDGRVVDAMIQGTSIDAGTLQDEQRLKAELEKLHAWLERHHPEALPLQIFVADDEAHASKRVTIRSHGAGTWRETVLDHLTLASPEAQELRRYARDLAALGPAPYRLTIGNAEHEAPTFQAILDLVN